MPGITGIISKKLQEKNERDLNLMIDCMMHEPSYNNGTYVNKKIGLYAGWVCHKDSFSDCMPVLNEKRDIILLFSGENFVDKNLINHLKARGHKFDTFNASYLIHMYENEGDKFFQHLNGWFCGIILDLRKAKIVLFNDRYGMQRIYYYKSKDEFIFSSEAKSLLKVRSELRKIDLKSLGELFIYDCVLENRTLFPNIFLLPGGSAWTFDNGNFLKKDFYFKPSEWENQSILEKEIFYKKLRETFFNILPRYFYSKSPIGMSLTSGLDTRMIMSSLKDQTARFPCYTFSGMYHDTFDACIARKVAKACHQKHNIVLLDGKFFSDFPNLAEKTIYITDGCLDVCGSHNIYFNRFARDISPIRMTGKFGSEVLRDLTQFKAITLHEKLFHPDFIEYVEQAIKIFSEIKKGHKLSFAVFKEIPWHEYGRLAIEMSILTLRTPYMDNDFVKLIYQAPLNIRNSVEIPLRLIEDNNPTLRKILTDRGTCGKSNPLFSKFAQLFYYCLFKAEYIYLYELPDFLVKVDYKLSPLHLERLIIGRYKFEHYRLWFRNEISKYVREVLLDRKTSNRPYLNKKFLKKIVNDHTNGNRNYFYEINKILTAELIYRLFIDNI